MKQDVIKRVGVIIGKFQPLMKKQIERMFKPALEHSDLVIVLLGSSNCARNCFNPLNNAERIAMIMKEDVDLGYAQNKIAFEPIRDFLYQDSSSDWIIQVQNKVHKVLSETSFFTAVDPNPNITLYGIEGDETKDYHTWFPHWNLNITHCSGLVDGREIFEVLWNTDRSKLKQHPLLVDNLSSETIRFLYNWTDTQACGDLNFKKLKDEYFYVKDYIARTQTGKYPIIFQTVDNVVYYKGNILLVKRKSKPGEGTYALPGGFLDATESCLDGAMRELEEETSLRVKKEWLISRDTFDHPQRSIRGRTITNAFLWKLPDEKYVPQIQAGSDAAKVKWFPIATIMEEMPERIFEDHLDIISALLKRL